MGVFAYVYFNNFVKHPVATMSYILDKVGGTTRQRGEARGSAERVHEYLAWYKKFVLQKCGRI